MNIKISLYFFIFLVNYAGKAQEVETFEKLIANNWALHSFEVNGERFPPRERNRNDRMVFNADRTAASISGENVQEGTWTYNAASQVITVTDVHHKFDMQLKLISITTTECVLELENPEGTFVRLHMVSIQK